MRQAQQKVILKQALKRTQRIPSEAELKAQIETANQESKTSKTDALQNVSKQTVTSHNQEVTQESLLKTWLRFFDELPQQTQRLRILRNKKITLEEGHKIIIPISGITEEDALKPHKEKLLYFLKKTLQNNLLELISVRQKQSDSQSAKPYTNRDKFKHLAKKYPILLELQKRFKLDI